MRNPQSRLPGLPGSLRIGCRPGLTWINGDDCNPLLGTCHLSTLRLLLNPCIQCPLIVDGVIIRSSGNHRILVLAACWAHNFEAEDVERPFPGLTHISARNHPTQHQDAHVRINLVAGISFKLTAPGGTRETVRQPRSHSSIRSAQVALNSHSVSLADSGSDLIGLAASGGCSIPRLKLRHNLCAGCQLSGAQH